ISFRLGDDRLLDLVGQPAAHTPDPIADIGSSCILIAIQPELNDDETSLLPSDRANEVDTLDAGDGLLEHTRDLTFEDLRAGTPPDSLHEHHRSVDVRIFADREAAERNDADEYDNQTQNRREHWTADAKVGKQHWSGSCWADGPDRQTVPELDRAFRDDHRVGAQPLDDLDLTLATLARSDLGHHGFAIDHAVDELVIADRHQCRFRHHDRLLALVHQQGHTGKHA